MTVTSGTRTAEWRQHLAFGVLSVVAAGFTGILCFSLGGAGFFEPYFGHRSPLLAVAVTALAGMTSLAFLRSRGWFEICGSRSARGAAVSTALATLFGVWQICADVLATRLPEDINVPPPHSLLFYPVMAYVVEVVFHALPLALLLALLGRSTRQAKLDVVVWPCIVFTSTLEPVLVHLRSGASAYVGVFVFVFTLVELAVFRRYDFISMYAFRLVFYLWWHVVWGYLRLRWLF